MEDTQNEAVQAIEAELESAANGVPINLQKAYAALDSIKTELERLSDKVLEYELGYRGWS